jgi:hypothetical protein
MTPARVRFYKDPIQSFCRPLRNSELKLLRFLEDHMLDELVCYRHLRYLRLTRMCPYCQSLTSYTLLRFEGLGGRHIQRRRLESIPTFVEIPWAFEATRFILRSLTKEDIKYLDAGGQSQPDRRDRTISGHTELLPPRPAMQATEPPNSITYRQSAERGNFSRRKSEELYYEYSDLGFCFSKLVLTTTRNR